MSAATISHDSVHWYAVWTRARHEHKVHDQLMRKEIEAFLPTVTRWSRWKDRRKRIDWPLFPSYCFARLTGEKRLAVLTCAGVVNIVSCEGKPVPVPDFEVDNLRLLMERKLRFDPCPLLTEGAEVEVVGGPLRGVIGRLMRKDLNRATVVLSVNLIGQALRVEVDAGDVAAR